MYLTVAISLIAGGYAIANAGVVLTVNIGRLDSATIHTDAESLPLLATTAATTATNVVNEAINKQVQADVAAAVAKETAMQQTDHHETGQVHHILQENTPDLTVLQRETHPEHDHSHVSLDSTTVHQLHPLHHTPDPHPEYGPSLYKSGLSALNIEGRELAMEDLDGIVTLFVNVASQCGYTESNYVELQRVYERYRDFGFEVLA